MGKDSSYLKNLMPRVFRTEGDVVAFDPIKIEQSLIRETGLNQETAGRITELLVRRVVSSGIKFLSGPHIREIVCSILSEQNFEEERKLYTRIGMPLMDYEHLLEKDYKKESNQLINPEKIHHLAANQLAEEYSLLRLLNDEESHAHLYGDIYIHQLKYFDLRPCSQVLDPRIILKYGLPPVKNSEHISKMGPPNNLLEATYQLSRWIIMLQKEFSEYQRLEFLSVFLAPYILGLSEEQLKNILNLFIFDLNQISLVTAANMNNTSISWTPKPIDKILNLSAIGPNGKEEGIYRDYIDECLKIFDTITHIYLQGDFARNSFLSPKHFIFITNSWLKEFENIYDNVVEETRKTATPYFINFNPDWVKDQYLNCYSKNIANHGILQNVSINLPRIAYLTSDEEKFVESLVQKMDMCFPILLKKYDIIQKRIENKNLPIFSSNINNEPLFDLNNQDLAISFIGLNEALKFITDFELHESRETFDLGKRIIKEMNKICIEKSNHFNKNFALIESNTKHAVKRFTRLDLKHFSKIVNKKSYPKKYYQYHNSACFNNENKLILKEKILKRAEFHNLIRKGVIEHISLHKYKQYFQNIEDFKEFLLYICSETTIAKLKFVL